MNTPPPLDFDHLKGYEIPTKHKEAIRQLYWFSKVLRAVIGRRYNLGKSTIRRILIYDKPERRRLGRIGPKEKLTNARMNDIIYYISQEWATRILDYDQLVRELYLDCVPATLRNRLHQKGYYRCVACQKPYLTWKQAMDRWIWGLAHIFWTIEWFKVLRSDEVTFLIGGRLAKQRVTRKKGERYCDTCI